jgi:glycosyltransferase involved in cell wall biosynthesis
MKVLLISSIFPNSTEKERGIFTYRIATAMKSMCRMEVIAPLPWVPPIVKRLGGGRKFIHANVPSQENLGGLTVHHPRYLVIPKFMSFTHPLFLYARLLCLTAKLNRKDPIDIINAHWLFPDGVAATWVARRLGKPLVLTGLGCDVNHYPSLLFRGEQPKRALNNANLITVKGTALKQKILLMGIKENKVTVIPNGLDFGQFKVIDRIEARHRLGIPENLPFVLFVGSLDQIKGGEYLIEALKEMARYPDSFPHLLMLGDGPQQEALLSRAEKLGIADRVSFLGKRPHNEIPLWMNAADVFCLPSIREGRPNVLLEALACGTPVVASGVGSVPEIINENNGRIAKTKDPKNLSVQIRSCVQRSWDREAIRNSLNRITWEECAASYIAAFKTAFRNHKR